MATYTATAAQSTSPHKGLRVGLVGVRSTYSIAATISAGDVFQMVKVPAGATPIFVQFGSSNNTPSFIMEVGDGISTARYYSVDSYSIAQGMRLANVNKAVILPPYTYSVDDTIDIILSTITASDQTTGGAFYMNVIFSMDP